MSRRLRVWFFLRTTEAHTLLPEHWDVGDLAAGFWVDQDAELTLDVERRVAWVPPSQVLWVEFE